MHGTDEAVAEPCQVRRLHHVGIQALTVSFGDGRLIGIGCQPDDRNLPQVRPALQLLENLPAIHSRKIEIQDDDVWSRRSFVASNMAKKIEALNSITNVVGPNRG